MRPLLPDKLFFRIGEVADIVGVRAHVLRYWESEFGILKPMKTRGAHRQYRRRDVELALVIKRLLQEEGFTTAGAKKRLRELGHVEQKADAPKPEDPSVALRAELLTLRTELGALLARIDGLGTRRSPVVVLEERPGPLVPVVALPTDGAHRRFSE
jgi:DNA-binding transcriptional MerR regulator